MRIVREREVARRARVDRRGAVRRRATSGFAIGLLVLGARGVEAHQAGGHGDGPDGLAASIAVAALAALALALVPWLVTRPPRGLAALLVVGFVSALTLELAIHSVHHLGSPEGAAKCQVLFASKHLSGDCAAPPPRPEGPAEGNPVTSAASTATRPDPAVGPDRERGPPAGSA
jgi:hypothetical protein